MHQSRVVLWAVIPVLAVVALGFLAKQAQHSARSGGERPASRRVSQTQHAGAAATAATRLSTNVSGSEKSSHSHPSSVVMTGRVMLPNGAPATSASVEAVRFDSASMPGARSVSLVDRHVAARADAGTDNEGRFRLETDEKELSWLVVRYPRFAKAVVPLERATPGSPMPIRDIVLLPAAPMSGRVTDRQGKPVAGARVAAVPSHRLFAAAAEATTSSASGEFSFDCFTSASAVAFSACAPDYVPFSGTTQLPKTDLTVVLEQGGASIQGTVRLKTNGQAVGGARVFAHPQTGDSARSAITPPPVATSRDDGTFVLEHLAAGGYQLMGEKDHLRTYAPPGRNTVRVQLAEAESATGREVLLYPGLTVSGRVTDVITTKGLAGVRVSHGSADDELSTLTAADGTYRLEDVTPLSLGSRVLSLKAERTGYVVASRRGSRMSTIRLSPDELDVRCDISMIPAVAITGIVRKPDGSPLPAATVAERSGRSPVQESPEQTDASGHFSVLVTPFRTAVLEASVPGFPKAHSAPLQVRDTPLSNTEIVIGPGATITGKVVDESGNTLDQAEVVARERRGGGTDVRALSDADGVFHLSPLPQGSVDLSARKDGYRQANQVRIQVNFGETTGGVELVMNEQHIIAGMVKDTNDKPLPGVRVSARGQRRGGRGGRGGGRGGRGGNAVTAPDGTYRIDNLSSGTYSVTADATGYQGVTKQDIQTDRTDVSFALKATGSSTFVGKVVNAQSSQPLADFQATELQGRTVAKNVEPGSFKVENVPNDTRVQFSISAPGFASLRTNPITMDTSKTVTEQTFQLEPECHIKGRTVNVGSHTGIAGVKVTFTGGGGGGRGGRGGGGGRNGAPVPSVVTDETGAFQASGLSSGVWTVVFQPPSAAPGGEVNRQVTLEVGGVSDMGDVEIGSGCALKGHVLQAAGNKPVTGALVSISGPGSAPPATTDSSGAFTFAGLRNGSYVVAVPDHSIRATFNLQPNETRDVTLYLGTATLSGVVVYDGKPVEATLQLVSASSADRQEKQVSSNTDGLYSVQGLSAGEWTVTVSGRRSGPRGVSVTETVKMPEKGNLEKNFSLPSSRITGVVLDESGKPAPGARVTVQSAEVQPDSWSTVTPVGYTEKGAQTGPDGTFSIGGLAPAQYSVNATHDQLGRGQVDGVVATDQNAAPITITLSNKGNCTLVSVALNMSTGVGLRSAWCMLWLGDQRINHSARRDQNGVMIITGLDPGSYRVQVSDYGFSVGEHTVQLTPGKETSIEDVLYESGALRIHVWDAAGKPASGVTCSMQPLDRTSIEQARQGQTDTSGVWSVRGLIPGMYNVMAAMPGGKTVQSTVQVQSRQASDFDLR